MAIYNKEDAKAIMAKALEYSKADGCEVNLSGFDSGNIRYARNTVSTAGAQSNQTLVVQSNFGKKVGTATIEEFDDASIEKVVRRAEELATLSPESEEFMEPLGPQKIVKSNQHFKSTSKISPKYRAAVAAASIEPAKAKGVTAAGFFEDYSDFSAISNSKGLFAYERSTGMDFTVTMRSNDGSGSGWVTRDYNDVSRFDAETASQIAIDKALQSREAKAIEPGKYTVILEPAASIGLLRNMLFSFNARSADEGRSFMSKEGGGNKIGEKIVDERINLYSDPLNPLVPASTWTGEGMPREKTAWLENGVVKNLAYGRYWADQKGVAPLPFPANGIMDGGDASLEI